MESPFLVTLLLSAPLFDALYCSVSVRHKITNHVSNLFHRIRPFDSHFPLGFSCGTLMFGIRTRHIYIYEITYWICHNTTNVPVMQIVDNSYAKREISGNYILVELLITIKFWFCNIRSNFTHILEKVIFLSFIMPCIIQINWSDYYYMLIKLASTNSVFAENLRNLSFKYQSSLLEKIGRNHIPFY